MTTKEVTGQYYNEFLKLQAEGQDDLKTLMYKYPIIAVICEIVLPILGLLLVFTFTLSGLVTGAALLALTYFGGATIYENCGEFWGHLRQSIGSFLLGAPTAETKKDQK